MVTIDELARHDARMFSTLGAQWPARAGCNRRQEQVDGEDGWFARYEQSTRAQGYADEMAGRRLTAQVV